MIRPTVARVDLGALKSNYRHVVEYLAREQASGAVFAEAAGSGVQRPARSAPGVIAVVEANARTWRRPGRVGTEDAGADLLACADIEEGAALRGGRARRFSSSGR